MSRSHSLSDLIFEGFNSRVIALARRDGEVVWTWKAPKGSGSYVALLLDGDRLIASVQGYTYCLDPRTGDLLWENHLAGHGFGIPSLVSVRGMSVGASAGAVCEEIQRNENSDAGTSH